MHELTGPSYNLIYNIVLDIMGPTEQVCVISYIYDIKFIFIFYIFSYLIVFEKIYHYWLLHLIINVFECDIHI